MPEEQALQPLETDATLAEHDHPTRYSRVTAEQAGEIIRLRRINPKITYREIAAAIGVASVSTVSHWFRALDNDTVPEARKLAKSNALRGVMKLEEQVDHDDPRVSQGAAKALVALAGVQEGSQQVQVGVQVVVGSSTHPAGPDPFDGVVVERRND